MKHIRDLRAREGRPPLNRRRPSPMSREEERQAYAALFFTLAALSLLIAWGVMGLVRLFTH